MRSELVIGGKRVPISVPTLLPEDHGMEFKPGQGARRRFKKKPIDLFVLHWTGAENPPERVFKTLNNRSLGVEFAINREGLIYQFADPVYVDTFDAGRINPRSVGVEIVNYGFTWRKPIPKKGRDRGTYQTILNRRKRTFARFYPQQLASAICLADVLCKELSIPRRIPRDHDLTILNRTMKWRELNRFKGVIGHFHASKRKSDPGMDIMHAFSASGF